jgi:catechol 2,3-dioxygenase-like lactoylglutathione lyase family enzyme
MSLTAMTDKLPITGISEVVLSVADLPQMKAFYRDVLGFPVMAEYSMETELHDPQGKPTITFLVIAETRTPLGCHGHPQLLALIDHRRHIHARARLTGHDVNQSTLNHLAFEIPADTYEGHVSRLKQLGLELTFSEFPAMQARAMFFRDPEGNVLELICHTGNYQPES